MAIVVATDEENAKIHVPCTPSAQLVERGPFGLDASVEEIAQNNEPPGAGLSEQVVQAGQVMCSDGFWHGRTRSPKVLGFAEVNVGNVQRAEIGAVNGFVGQNIEFCPVPCDTQRGAMRVCGCGCGTGHGSG